jgi:hypothetical protein
MLCKIRLTFRYPHVCTCTVVGRGGRYVFLPTHAPPRHHYLRRYTHTAQSKQSNGGLSSSIPISSFSLPLCHNETKHTHYESNRSERILLITYRRSLYSRSMYSNDGYRDGRLWNGFDYLRQAWVVNGRYIGCGHQTPCDCYGTQHKGEEALEARINPKDVTVSSAPFFVTGVKGKS